jgi:hypothetical protein
MIGGAQNLDAAFIHHRQQDEYLGSARAHTHDLAQHNMVVDTVVDTSSRTLGKAAARCQDFSEDDGVESG